MGSYLFKWEHPANEVYVTGTFDDWGKTQKLEKVGDHFEKNVTLSKIDEKIYYKFVVDDNWTTDHTDPQETDASGNTNNVLAPEEIKKDVTQGSSGLPGAFPETPAAENQAFGINPIPASTGIGNPVSIRPGEALPIQTKSINDKVTLDKASYDNAGSSAIPQLPDVVTPERERAQKGGMFGLDTAGKDSTPGAGTKIPEAGGIAIGAGAGLGAAATAGSNPFISSVGPSSTTSQLAGQVPLEARDGPHISSVGPTSTTATLAGQVPLEKQVPDVVEKSQEAAHASPEASANPEAVQEKSAVEQELTSKVPEAPATSGDSISGKAAGIAAGVAASATAAVGGVAAYLQSGKATQDAKSTLPVAAQQKVDGYTKSSNGAAPTGTAIASTVPDTVQESITKAHQAPEAAANPEAVDEKSAVESELLKKVQPEESAGEPAPTMSAATATTAPSATTESAHDHTGGIGAGALAAIAGDTHSSTTGPTTAAAPTTPSKSTSEGLAAPASSQAQTDATAAKSSVSAADSLAAPSTPGRDTTRRAVDSRDVSPMTRGPAGSSSGPTVTSGVSSAKIEEKSSAPSATTSTPKKDTAAPTTIASASTSASPASTSKTGESPATDKKSKRKSGFFGRLKEKLSHKDKH